MDIQEHRKLMKSRGAIEISDGTGSGFDSFDQEFANPAVENDPVLARELQEIEDRQHDQKAPAQHIEVAEQWREGNLERVRKFKFDRQNEVTDYVPGRLMHMREFMRLLLKLNPTFSYNDYAVLGLRGLNYVDGGVKTYITAVHDGISIEWSQLRVDEHGIGTNERFRGWRSVLMTMIQKGILTEDDVHRVFGRPIGPRARRWNRNLFMVRNHYCPECESKICICAQIGELSRADNYARPN